MLAYGIPFWKRIPFLRILLPLIAGMITGFYLHIGLVWLIGGAVTGLTLILIGKVFGTPKRFRFRWIPGTGLYLLFFPMGCLLVVHKDIRNNRNWIGNHYTEGNAVIVTIREPLVEKPGSYKAIATIDSVLSNKVIRKVEGKVLLYFKKDSSQRPLHYGSQLMIVVPLQAVRNSGNPGGFDYKRYCAFQDIYHQVFLEPGNYKILQTTNADWLGKKLVDTREWVLAILRKYIRSKDELGVAEALLIGYRNDLDRELVQSYSNTGVVHIIAISGLHLGMIYGMMLWLFRGFRRNKWSRFIQPLVILFVLWTFTFLAGAAPSILRSAVMFTCIVAGEMLSKRTSVYNTLAASAFILLLIDPFYLWDVGFQLSFAAVLSIVVFSKHINNWFYFQNKMLGKIWSLSAITLSAQVLTLPVILYHFHQFPNLFLFTNLLIVPLSGLILFAELLLVIISIIPFIATYVGNAVEWLIWLMNTLIERTNRIPFSVTDNIQVTLLQSLAIYLVILLASAWLLQKNKRMLFACGIMLITFFALRSLEILNALRQQKLIVYNIPRHTAIDVIDGTTFTFIGDSVLRNDNFVQNFHLRPSRIMNRMDEGLLQNVSIDGQTILSHRKKIVVIDNPLPYNAQAEKTRVDAIIIAKNPNLYIDQLVKLYDCGLVVFDASNPPWKIQLWKKDCDSLHLRHHSVPEQGAFEMDLR